MQPMETQTVKILKSFLEVRQSTAECVQESINDRDTSITTYMSYDAEGNTLCEDIVLEERK